MPLCNGDLSHVVAKEASTDSDPRFYAVPQDIVAPIVAVCRKLRSDSRLKLRMDSESDAKQSFFMVRFS